MRKHGLLVKVHVYEGGYIMRYTLENEILAVEIDSFGAELKSVKRKSDDL